MRSNQKANDLDVPTNRKNDDVLTSRSSLNSSLRCLLASKARIVDNPSKVAVECENIGLRAKIEATF